MASNHIEHCLRSNSFFYNVQVLRDGKWSEEEAAILVPGDIISIKLGDIVPADARLLEGDPLKIDQVLLVSNFLDLYSSAFYLCREMNTVSIGHFCVLVCSLH